MMKEVLVKGDSILQSHIKMMSLYAYRDKMVKIIYYSLKVAVWAKLRWAKNKDVKYLKKIIGHLKIARLVCI